MGKKRLLGLSIAVGVLLSAAWLGVRIRAAEQADDLTLRAEHFLAPPLREASSFQDLRASEARALCDEAQTLAPSAARAALLAEARSLEQWQRGAYPRAEALLAEIPVAQRSARVIVFSAALALARKDPLEAQRRLGTLPSKSESTPRTLLVRSDVERALGRADAALAAAEGGVAIDPESAALLERRGLAYELLGDPVRARADLERAAQLDRHSNTALLALGRVLRANGELSNAVLAFHEAAQRDPNDAEAWLGSGVCRAALGDTASAQVDLERAGELAPTRADPLEALADVDTARGDLPAALRRYRAAVLLDPGSATARVKFGNALLRSGQVQEAAPAFRAAIERRPDLSAAHNGLGAALLAQGDLAGAESELKTAARLDLNDAHPLLNLARLYKRRGDPTALADALAEAEARDPHLLIASSSRVAPHLPVRH
jgi:tetratricopeptide (TPR) repeat protein